MPTSSLQHPPRQPAAAGTPIDGCHSDVLSADPRDTPRMRPRTSRLDELFTVSLDCPGRWRTVDVLVSSRRFGNVYDRTARPHQP